MNIREAVGEFMFKFFVALAVIMIVSLISLGWRVGIVVAAAVPLTLAAVFVVMLVTGRVFDRITLGALDHRLGLLVDDAIIAIEMMVVKLEEGFDRRESGRLRLESHGGADAVGHTGDDHRIHAGGFRPHRRPGEYAGNIFWIVGFALITSWVVAVVFTPYLGVKLLPRHHARRRRPRRQSIRHRATSACASSSLGRSP